MLHLKAACLNLDCESSPKNAVFGKSLTWHDPHPFHSLPLSPELTMATAHARRAPLAEEFVVPNLKRRLYSIGFLFCFFFCSNT